MTEPQVITYHGDAVADLPHHAWYGLYIVRSRDHPRLCRAGAAGFRNSIVERLRAHRGKAPLERKNPPNWTELHRPFFPVWIAHLPHANAVATRCCERELQSRLADVVRYVDESGFDADAQSDAMLVDLAEACLPTLRALLAFQTGPFFVKPARTGERWYATPAQA